MQQYALQIKKLEDELVKQDEKYKDLENIFGDELLENLRKQLEDELAKQQEKYKDLENIFGDELLEKLRKLLS
jgi:hypothetical protein